MEEKEELSSSGSSSPRVDGEADNRGRNDDGSTEEKYVTDVENSEHDGKDGKPKKKRKKHKKKKHKKKKHPVEEEEEDEDDKEEGVSMIVNSLQMSKLTEIAQRMKEQRATRGADFEKHEPRVDVGDKKGVLLRDIIVQRRSLYRPAYKPFTVAVKDLTYTVKAPPPGQGNPRLCPPQLPGLCNKKARKVKVDILKDVSFYLLPGEMTLLLGAPGCGKSTLFKLLAGRLRKGKVSGEITFNGKPPRKRYYHRDVAYVTQEDVHMPAMTVKETLTFSAKLQMPTTLPRKVAKERTEFLLQLLGLSHRADTIVGNEILRGISGGEKKRVTVGIESTKTPCLYLLDEPTTGLDASGALSLLRTMRTICDIGPPVLCALLQPSYELFCLFDRLIIMSQGEIAFQGYREDALSYFSRLGRYHCHENLNPAEFLQEIVESESSKDRNAIKFRDSADMDEAWHSREEFIENYRETQLPEVLEVIDEINATDDQDNDEKKSEERELLDKKKRKLYDYSKEAKYPTSIWYQFYLCLKRAISAERRAPQNFIARTVGSIVLALIVGTVFVGLGDGQSDARTKMGLLFFILSYFTFGGLASLPPLLTERPVFYMQRDAKYYKTVPYLMATIVSEIPLTVLEVLLYGTITYWMPGLSKDDSGARYFIFEGVMFSAFMCYKAFCRMVAALAPNNIVAMAIAPAGIAIFVLMAGFIIPRGSIPGWWIWLHYLSPSRYAYEAVANNEMRGQTFSCSGGDLVPPPAYPLFNVSYPVGFSGNQACPITSGTTFMDNSYDLTTEGWIIAVNVAVLWAYWCIFTFFSYVGMRWIRWDGKKGASPATEEEKQEQAETERKSLKDLSSEVSKFRKKSTKLHKASGPEGAFLQQGAYMSFDKLSYFVKTKVSGKRTKLQLLHEVNGYVKPGMMLALMGASGAGKSTLLDVLAKRKTGGKITGQILVNGQKPDVHLNRMIGYVEQTDVHMASQTVWEALLFSAMCRLPNSVSRKKKRAYAKEVLNVLGLQDIKNRLIGNNANDGISGDQRKRVTIGVELASNPSILFLDEPTSGLDSFGAERVMYAVKRAASQGKSIICTIHQPSATIFGMFTHLLLLKKGGYVTYFGPIGKEQGDFSQLLGYYEKLGFKCPPHKNPADFILEVNASGVPDAIEGEEDPEPVDLSEEYKESAYYKETKKLLKKGFVPAEGSSIALAKMKHKEKEEEEEEEKDEEEGNDKDEEKEEASDTDSGIDSGDDESSDSSGSGSDEEKQEEEEKGGRRRKWMRLSMTKVKEAKSRFSGRYAVPFYIQFYEIMKRNFVSYWRDPGGVKGKMLRSLNMGILLGTLFLQMDDDQRGASNRVALIYFALTFANLAAITTIPKIINERAVYYKERAACTYRSTVYTLGLLLAEIPFTLIALTLFTIPCYFISGLQYEADKFFIFYGFYVLINLVSLSIGQAIAVVAPNMILANAMVSILFSSFGLFAGFLISNERLPRYWIWAYYINPLAYPLEGMVANEFDGLTLTCSGNENVYVPISQLNNTVTKAFCGITTGERFLDNFSLSVDNIGRDAAILGSMWIFLVFLTALLFKFVNHNKR